MKITRKTRKIEAKTIRKSISERSWAVWSDQGRSRDGDGRTQDRPRRSETRPGRSICVQKVADFDMCLTFEMVSYNWSSGYQGIT